MNLWWIAAGLAAAFTAAVHLIFGGRDIDRPLMALAIDDRQIKYGAHLCWHLVSIELVALAAFYLWPAVTGRGTELAVAATLIAVASAVWNIVMVVRHRLGFGEFPQWTLFAVVAGLGLAGLV